MFFLSGFSQIKNSVSYVWLSECTSSTYKPSAFTYISAFDALPMILTCLMYLFVSKNWLYLPLIFCVLSFIASILAYICPESPRWLLVNGRSQEAITELNKIASMNKTRPIPENAMFVEDPRNI